MGKARRYLGGILGERVELGVTLGEGEGGLKIRLRFLRKDLRVPLGVPCRLL